MKKSVFGETVKNLHRCPAYAVLYGLGFLYGITSLAVLFRLMWELFIGKKTPVFFRLPLMAVCLVLSAAFFRLMKCISSAVWVWLFGAGEESDNRRYLPFAAGICVSLLAAGGFRDMAAVIGYYTATDLCVMPFTMVAAWLAVRAFNRIDCIL